MNRLPDFLVVGAMKAGTTSLYHDLSSQPEIYFPPGEKEPHALTDDRVLNDDGRTAYSSLYKGALPSQLCGDASTGYTKRPDIEGVPRRAETLLGRDLKVIYLVREPLARTISHHYHEFSRRELEGDLDTAVRCYPRLIDYSRYAYQIRAWLNVLNPERVKIVRFEDYIVDREGTLGDLCRFLGIEPRPELVPSAQVFGRTSQRSVPHGPLWRLTRTAAYRRYLRMLLPETSREWLRRKLLPKPPPRPPAPSDSTLRYIRSRLATDLEDLRNILDWTRPVWDLDRAMESLSVGKRGIHD